MSYDIYLEATVDTGGPQPYPVELYWADMTSNVAGMWRKAGCELKHFCPYQHNRARILVRETGEWRDETDEEMEASPCGKRVYTAGEAVEMLTAAVSRMKADPETFRAMNPSNGWGDYEGALKFLEELLAACRAHPKAVVRLSH